MKHFVLLFILGFFVACQKPKLFIDYTANVYGPFPKQERIDITHLKPKAKILVFNFFAPGCPPCEKEVPELRKLAGMWKNNPQIALIGIGSDLAAAAEEIALKDAYAAVEKFKKQFPLPYPIYVADSTALKKFRLTGFPETFIFTRTKKGLRFERKFISEITAVQITDFIETLNRTSHRPYQAY
ncbi:MAG: TlpA family protein disulfide reductase [Candidatus Hydrogenedentota bacterium]|nr:MAG: TlpA family protein disulfide reductase [Candidatus Hydrogenedentota bacterium]